MKTAAQFVHDVYYGEGEEETEQQWVNAVVARDAEIRAEEHEARTALFALERAAHKKELREVRAAALREVAAFVSSNVTEFPASKLYQMADRAERGE